MIFIRTIENEIYEIVVHNSQLNIYKNKYS